MDNRQLLILQTIITLPLLLFVSIYPNHISYIYIPTILAIFFGINIYRYKRQKSIIKPPLLSILIINFLFYVFSGLGSKTAPQTFENITTLNKNMVFKFRQKEHIDKFCYYIGIDKNAQFRLGYKKDNNRWEQFYKYDKNFPLSFRWNCESVDINTSEIGIILTKNSMLLGEIRFLDNNHTIPFSTTMSKLNDEPNINIDKSYYGSMFFDEIYFGRTAYEILHKLQIYETTHPFLGKGLISQGIKLFGMTPFGWRFVNAIFGTLMIIIIYYLALVIFDSRLWAIVGATILTYSFMHLTQARISIIDTFGVSFVLVAYYFFYRFILRQRLFWLLLSGVAFGLASAIKWSAVFSSLGFLVIGLFLIFSKYPLTKQFDGYRLVLYGVLSYIIVGLFVYYMTFYIYMEHNSFSDIINYQINMYKYHTALKATHPYSSPWWSWIIDFRPMCYYRDIKGGNFSSITAFGNPAIFWSGILAILYLFYVTIRYRRLDAIFILFAFLGLYLPYIFIGRLMFIYHFYYSVPFLILAIVYMWRDIYKYKYAKVLLYLYIVTIIGLFLEFYPVLSGYIVPKWYIDNFLVWFNGWWL